MDYLMLVDKFNPIDMGFYDRVELTEVNGKFMESQAGNSRCFGSVKYLTKCGAV